MAKNSSFFIIYDFVMSSFHRSPQLKHQSRFILCFWGHELRPYGKGQKDEQYKTPCDFPSHFNKNKFLKYKICARMCVVCLRVCVLTKYKNSSAEPECWISSSSCRGWHLIILFCPEDIYLT
jgi:hypothetical protein